jgi:hypothetical protein
MPQPAPRHAGQTDQAAPRGAALTRLAGVTGALRRHWIASALLLAGIVLRILTQMAYHPAILYIDSLKYLYPVWYGSDPVEYKIPLKFLFAFGGTLGTVEFVQHLLGIAMAILIYAVVVRRGAPRWLGALAMAPVLLDAYQLQAEAMIMPDIWFEAMVVLGLVLVLWRPTPSMRLLAIGAFLLGAATGMRQVGEVLIVPLLIIVVAMGGGWRQIAKNAVVVTAAFAVALVGYLSASLYLTHHFWISRSQVSLTYGRMAEVANCTTLQVPEIEEPLCPTKAEVAKGPDWLEHNLLGPYRSFKATLPVALQPHSDQYVARFDRAVETQQPLQVLSGIASDSVKLFALTRNSRQGDTPIWRWQFQGNYPTYCPYIMVGHCPGVTLPAGAIWLTFPPGYHGLHAQSVHKLTSWYGGPPQVNTSIAWFLRKYQLRGGYTPGPLLLLFVLTGLAGSVLLVARRRLAGTGRQLALACLSFFVTGVAILVASDFFEFSWRYQLPAIVTLPVAGALGIAVIAAAIRGPSEAPPSEAVSDPQAPGRQSELAAPAS